MMHPISFILYYILFLLNFLDMIMPYSINWAVALNNKWNISMHCTRQGIFNYIKCTRGHTMVWEMQNENELVIINNER
jgi:hypothetical protein